MKLLPSENLMLQTPLPRATVFERLSRLVTADAGNINNLQFEGKVDNNSFLLRQYAAQSSLFIPEIQGELSEDDNGTAIRLHMKPTSGIAKFVTIWLAGVVLGLALIIFAGFFDGGSKAAALIPCAILGAGIGFLNVGFNSENQKVKKALAEILDARIGY